MSLVAAVPRTVNVPVVPPQASPGSHTPAWSPDGQSIAFQSNRAGNMDIYVMAADGSNPIRLTDSPADDGMPAWSPDGRRVAYSSGVSGNRHIFVIGLHGSA